MRPSIYWRMPPCADPTAAGLYDDPIVHTQGFDRRTATGCFSKYKRAAFIPAKMVGPVLAEWVKERHFDSGLWINTVLLGGFVDIAGKTDLAKIARKCWTASAFWHDMIDVHCLA